MRICYLTVGGESLRSGYHQKIFATVNVWRELGADAMLSIGTRAGSPADRDFTAGIGRSDFAKLWTWPSGTRRVFSEFKAAKSIQAWQPDILYIRSAYYTPGLIPLLNAVPSFLEINTNEDVERRLMGRLQHIYFKISSSYIYPRARGFVAVTRGIAALPRYANSNKPVKVIANGVPLRKFTVKPLSAERSPTLLVLISQEYLHHGLDKLPPLVRRFPDWRFIFVGNLNIPEPLRGFSNIEAHPFLPREEFEPLLARAHVGISSLGMHRNNLLEGSVLKTREYLANGLPVILGYEDTDFPNSAEFLLQIGNHERNVAESLDKIEAFVRKWMHRRVQHSEVRAIDMFEKERERLRFLCKVSGVEFLPESITYVAA